MDWLPFTYDISNKPYGRQHLSTTKVRGSMPVDLEVIDIDANDPAITILNQVQPAPSDHYGTTRAATYAPPCELTYYRTADGRLVRPIYFDHGVELTSEIAKAGAMPDGSPGKDMKDYPLLGQYSSNPFALESDEVAAPAIYRIVTDDRETREKEAQERAASILKCGDIFYKEVPEPVIELQFSGITRAKDRSKKDDFDRRGVVLKVNVGGIGEVLDDSVVFRIDEYDIAHELAYEICAMGRQMDPVIFGEVYQVDGQAVEFDAYPNARTKLAQALSHQKTHGFGDVTLEHIEQWLGVMRMMADIETTDLEVAAATRAYFDNLPAKDTRSDRQKLFGVISRFETVERQEDPDLVLAISGFGPP